METFSLKLIPGYAQREEAEAEVEKVAAAAAAAVAAEAEAQVMASEAAEVDREGGANHTGSQFRCELFFH